MRLRFECTQCGRCCLGTGTVRVTEEEIAAIQRILPLPMEMLVEASGSGFTLRTVRDGPEERCILLGADNRCRAYEARPVQCRTFPFWPRHLASRSAWDELARHCEGVGRGPEIDPAIVRAALAQSHPD